MYANGEGVEKSYEKAAEWFGMAADQEHTGAQASLEELLFEDNFFLTLRK